MSYPPPYQGPPHYPDVYLGSNASGSSSSTPHIPQSMQLPGAYPVTQWDQPQDLHALHSPHDHDSIHSMTATPMQTPTSTSFPQMELEDPPHLVPSQPVQGMRSNSQGGSPVDAPVLLHHPLLRHQQQQYQQQLEQQFQHHQRYGYLAQQQQQYPPQQHHLQHMQQPQQQQQQHSPTDLQNPHFSSGSRPSSSALLFRPPLPSLSQPQPQPGPGIIRSAQTTTSLTRAAAAHPYYRRTSGGTLALSSGSPLQYAHDSPGRFDSEGSPAPTSAISPGGRGGVGVETITVPPAPTPIPVAAIMGAATATSPTATAKPATTKTVTTSKRTRSATTTGVTRVRKSSVRFEEGIKASTPAPGVPASAPGVPLLRSAARRGSGSVSGGTPAMTTTSASSPSQSTSTSGAAVPGPNVVSGSGGRVPSTSTSASTRHRPYPPTKPPSSTSSSTPSSAQTTTMTNTTPNRLPLTSIPADMHYSPHTHILTASLELPGVKREHLHVKLGTCYFNRVKFVVVVARSVPVFGFGGGGGGVGRDVESQLREGEKDGTYVIGKEGGNETSDVARKEEEEEEEEGIEKEREEEEEGEEEEEEEEEKGRKDGAKMKVERSLVVAPSGDKTSMAGRADSRSRSPPSALEKALSALDVPSTRNAMASPPPLPPQPLSPILEKYGLPKIQVDQARSQSPAQVQDAEHDDQFKKRGKGKGKTSPITLSTSSTTTGASAKAGGVSRIVNPNLRERRFGIMRRVIQVPGDTTLAQINAALEDGVLTLQIDFGPPYEIDDEVDVPVR